MRTPIQDQIVATLEAMAEDQGYQKVRVLYDDDNELLTCQLSITHERLMDRLGSARHLPQVPIDILVRRIVARQVGKGLRRYGRRR
jgi:hypothetical protein